VVEAAVAKLDRHLTSRGEVLWVNLTAPEYFIERTGRRWPPLSVLINFGTSRKWKTSSTFAALEYVTGSLHNADMVRLGAAGGGFPRPTDYFEAAENGIAGLDYDCPKSDGA